LPFRFPLSLLGVLAAIAAVFVVVAAHASEASLPAGPGLQTMRAAVDHYRGVTWVYERAARARRTPTSYSYRRSVDKAYLQWTVTAWQRRAYQARARALRRIHQRLRVPIPPAPQLRAPISRRLNYDRALARRLQSVYKGVPTRSLDSARPSNPQQRLKVWDRRVAAATLAVSLRAEGLTIAGPRSLTEKFLCIHRYEGDWTSNTGNGYFGGLQMDWTFMQRYGADYLALWGTADRWPPWAQVEASVRAYDAGRGFYPWPHTAAACGLL
jgi:hypothetical protein